MNKINLYLVFVIIAISICFVSCNKEKKQPSGKVLVEILYMNHGPVQPVLTKLKSEFKQFENRVDFKWYDFEKDLQFKKEKGIDFHVPIVVWVNNQTSIVIDGQTVLFQGFPIDQGPKFARGVWNIKQLITAINNAVGEK